ncbi:putative vacuolar protein sorting-associated protein 62, partial [Tanacetum coccineum]
MFEFFKSYYSTGGLKQQQKSYVLPSPIPQWPQGEGCFNTGRIRLNGELELAMEKVFVWEPIPHVGYRALGFVVTTCSNVGYQIEPDVQLVRCFCKPIIFSGANINCGDVLNLRYLKNSNLEATMPNLEQVKALIHHYGPTVYFHPDEVYLPSSVPWYFKNFSEEGVKHGCLKTAEVYVQVKPAIGGAFTDIDMLIFFLYVRLDTFSLKPFNLNIEMMNKKAGEKAGEYVVHWDHFTLRISNFDSQLWRVNFPDHSGKKLVEATCLEFIQG